jgi:tetratricopeptide (TPR) repeat protein
MTLYRQMIDIAPGDERAHYNLATLLKRKGDYAEALAHFRRAAELKPTYTLALFNAGDILERAQQKKEAAEAYEKAIASDGEFVPALANLSRILAFSSDPALHDVDRAVLLAEKAARLATEADAPLALDSLSAVYGAAGRYREAGENLAKAMDLMKERGDSATQSRYLADATRRLDYYRGHADTAAGQ